MAAVPAAAYLKTGLSILGAVWNVKNIHAVQKPSDDKYPGFFLN